MPKLRAWFARNRRGLIKLTIAVAYSSLLYAEIEGLSVALAFAVYVSAPVVAHLAGRGRRARKGGAP